MTTAFSNKKNISLHQSNPYNRKKKWTSVIPSNEKEIESQLKQLHADKTPIGLHLSDLTHVDGALFQLNHFNQLPHHWPDDLTVQAQLGITLGDLNHRLAPYQQCWPHSAPPSTPLYRIFTTGLTSTQTGLTPTHINDSLLGMTTALPCGTLIKTGGRVRKNVSGYDMRPLWLGTQGAYGLPVLANLSLSPTTESQHTLLAGFSTLHNAHQWVETHRKHSGHISGCAILSQNQLTLIQKLSPQLAKKLKPYRQKACQWVAWIHRRGTEETLTHDINNIQQHLNLQPDFLPTEDGPLFIKQSNFDPIAHYITGYHASVSPIFNHIRIEYTPPYKEGWDAFQEFYNHLEKSHLPYGLDFNFIFQPATQQTIILITSQSDLQLNDSRIDEYFLSTLQSSTLSSQYVQITHAPPERLEWSTTYNQPASPIHQELFNSLKRQFDPEQLIQHPLFPL